MNRIDDLFESAKRDGKTAFVPFLVAGDPDLSTTFRIAGSIADAASEAGVPMVLEIGFPYSDPLADGPTIQAAYCRALDNGIRVESILAAISAFRVKYDIPIVAMISYTIIHRRGLPVFQAAAKSAGIDGLIVPDLPVEESETVLSLGQQNDLKIIELIAPTTRPDRLPAIASSSTGFIYYISVTGITGERTSLPADLVSKVAMLREYASVPVCVGFGVSRPEQVAELAKIADGVIVGSALVRRISELSKTTDPEPVVAFVRELIKPLATASIE